MASNPYNNNMLMLLPLLLFPTLASAQESMPPPPMNVTAIASRNGYSVLECWQLDSAPVFARSALNYNIATKLSTATWSTIAPRTYVGQAWAPAVQFTIVLNGLIHVTAPFSAPASAGEGACYGGAQRPLDSSDNASSSGGGGGGNCAAMQEDPKQVTYVMPGTTQASIILATDLKDTSPMAGHGAYFPSDQTTVLVQLPFENNEIPGHTVVASGPC